MKELVSYEYIRKMTKDARPLWDTFESPASNPQLRGKDSRLRRADLRPYNRTQ